MEVNGPVGQTIAEAQETTLNDCGTWILKQSKTSVCFYDIINLLILFFN